MMNRLLLSKYINRIYVILLFGLTPYIVTFNSFDNYSYGKIMFATVITVGFWLYNVVVGDKFRRNIKLNTHVLLLFVLLTTSTLFSIDNSVSVFGVRYAPEGFVSLALLLVIFYVFYNFVRIDELTIELVLMCSLVVSLIAIFEFVGVINPLITLTEQTYFYSVNYTTIGNRNFLGTYSIIMLTMSMSLLVFSKQRRAFLYVGVSVTVVLISQTRSAYVALVFIIIMSFIMIAKTKRDVIRNILLLIAVLCMGFASLYFISYALNDNRIINRIMMLIGSIRNINIDPDGTDRLSIWYRMFPFIWERPLVGFGPDTFGTIFQTNFGFLELIYHKAHNEWLQILLTLGIPYFLIFINLKYKAFKNTILNMKEHPLYQMIVLVLIGYIVQSFFNISVAGNSFIFYGILGLALKEPDRISFDGKDKEYIRGS